MLGSRDQHLLTLVRVVLGVVSKGVGSTEVGRGMRQGDLLLGVICCLDMGGW